MSSQRQLSKREKQALLNQLWEDETEDNDADRAQMDRVVGSAEYLAENLELAPALIIPCIEGRSDIPAGPMTNLMQASVLGSILPAFWSFMLAARARGLGTAWTTVTLMQEQAIADIEEQARRQGIRL